MEIRVETVTGDDARRIVRASGLQGYGHREKVEGYKRWMMAGKWSLFYNGTGNRFINDPLIFHLNGKLLEGKHRIIALSELEGDFEAPFWVLRDFTAFDAFFRWLNDREAGTLPKSVAIDAPTRSPLP